MRLDYYTLLSPEPIRLSIGDLRQPTCREISKLSYPKYLQYLLYLKSSAKEIIDNHKSIHEDSFWNNFSDEEIQDLSVYDVIIYDDIIMNIFVEIFNFFFIQRVAFIDRIFLIIETDDYETPTSELEITKENLRGVISSKTFDDVIDILQQICCIKSKSFLDEKKPKFKNEKAKKMYDKMLKAKEKKMKEEAEKNAKEFTFANIISAVAAKSFNLNIINIWDATPFQIYDQFEKLRCGDSHYINEVRVSVWGDEKNEFDSSLWYKNNYD